MRDNLLAVSALKISGRFRLFCVQIDQLHELNHIFNHKIQHVMFCESTYTKCLDLVSYLPKRNLIPELYFAANLRSIRRDNVKSSSVKSTTHY